jgi:DNA-nicking Smr family endonuclease
MAQDVWQTYIMGVKKTSKTASLRRPSQPSGLRRGLRSRQSCAAAEAEKPESIGTSHNKSLSLDSSNDIAWTPTFAGVTHKEKPGLASLDHRVEKNIRQGEITLDARIDLHGMTQQKAFEALARFMAANTKAGRCNLLVITGKGKNKEGIIRTSLPGWLQALPEAKRILALRPAAPKHGGDGAFYVLLKKKKG